MTKWKIGGLITVTVVTAAVWYGHIKGPHSNIPSDLRDAVADNGEFSTSLPVLGKDSGNIPAPKAEVDSTLVNTDPFAYTGAAKAMCKKKFGGKARISGIQVYGPKSNDQYMMVIGVYSPKFMSFTCDAMEVGVRRDGTLVEIATMSLGTLLMGEPLHEDAFKISLDQARKTAIAAGFGETRVSIYGTTYNIYDDKNHTVIHVSGKTGAVIGTEKQ